MHRLILICLLALCLAPDNNAQVQSISRKVSPAVSRIISHPNGDSVELLVSFSHAQSVIPSSARVLGRYMPARVAKVRVPAHKVSALAADSSILFIDIKRKPVEEYVSGNLDISLNRVNLAARNFPDISGGSLNFSLKEQRFDTGDIDIKGRWFDTRTAAQTQSAHASAMASIVAGAGNSTPSARGVATAARISSSDFESLLPDDDELYKQYEVWVQNHSYGTAIENYYGADAAAFDASTFNNPKLLHVFSSGNSGVSAADYGRYQGLSGYANLTGSFKMAKNIITVGATDSFGKVTDLSSRGPAFDGRVRPEIVAFGEDGSSGSAALVSGAALLVQQALKEKHGSIPEAALVKAVLLNSADNGKTSVNYISGYGSLDVNRALQLVFNGSYFQGIAEKNASRTFKLNVPSNTARIKVMVTWTDPPASPNSAKVLVNDLDLQLVHESSGQTYLPWVLDHRPNIEALSAPAKRSIDTLNNVEQVTIHQPAAGIYEIQILGTRLEQSQAFAVTYVVEKAMDFTWTYPTRNDHPQAGKESIVRWHTDIEGSAVLEYSFGGDSWQQLSTVELSNQFARWQVPDTFAHVQLRVRMSDSNIASDTFTIAPAIDLRVGYNCEDSVLYYWNGIPGVTYNVYVLGSTYLEQRVKTSDSFFVFDRRGEPSLHFAVSPAINDGEGLRSYAVDYTNQGVNCYFQNFFATLAPDHSVLLEATLGTIFGIKQVQYQKLGTSGFTTLFESSLTSQQLPAFIDNHPQHGINTYRVEILLNSGRKIYSDVESVFYLPEGTALVYPNPVSRNREFSVISAEPNLYSLTVFDLNGRTILRTNLDDSRKTFNTNNLNKGIYLLRFTSAGGTSFTKKLIVN